MKGWWTEKETKAEKVVSVLCARGPGQHMGGGGVGGVIWVWNRRHHRGHRLWWNGLIMKLYILIKHEVRGKVEHPAVDVFVGPPSQGKHHHSHPRMLDDSHLVVHVEVSETWVSEILLSAQHALLQRFWTKKYNYKTINKQLFLHRFQLIDPYLS